MSAPRPLPERVTHERVCRVYDLVNDLLTADQASQVNDLIRDLVATVTLPPPMIWPVVVECASEDVQDHVLELLGDEGYACFGLLPAESVLPPSPDPSLG